MNERLRVGFSILIGFAWIANLVLGAVWSGYSNVGNVSLAINAPLMLVLGSLFANRPQRSGDDKK